MLKNRWVILTAILSLTVVMGCDEEDVEGEPEQTEEVAEAQPDQADEEQEEADEEEPDDFFADVDSDVGLFARAVDPEPGAGAAVHHGGDFATEFCYEDDGCEVVSDSSMQMLGTVEESLMYGSDPDRTLVGMKVEVEVPRGSRAPVQLLVYEGTHDPDAGMGDEAFETGEVLKETETYTEDNVITFELGNTN